MLGKVGQDRQHVVNYPIDMLIIKRNEGESVDKMLRRYKRKYKDSRILQEAKHKMYFTKPSDRRRAERNRAKYANKLRVAGEI